MSYSAGSASVQIVPDFSGAQRKLQEFFARQGNAEIGVDANLNRASLARVNSQIDSHNSSKLKLDADFSKVETKMAKFLDSAVGFSQVGNIFSTIFGPRSILMTSGVGAFTALAAAASSALPAIGLLPAAIAGIGAPLAALAVGVHGVMGAFQALSAQDNSAAADAKAGALARQAATASLVSAQQQVVASERALEMAHRSVSDAERAVVLSQKEVVLAQNDLTKARLDATRQLQDMNMELAKTALDEQAATLNLESAQLRLNQVLAGTAAAAKLRQQATLDLNKAEAALNRTLADPMANDADKAAATQMVSDARSHLADVTGQQTAQEKLNREEAELAVKQAKQGITDIQVKRARLTVDTAKANKLGVEGSAGVVAAQMKVQATTQAHEMAVRSLGDAQYNVGIAQENVTKSVIALAAAQAALNRATNDGSASQKAAAAAMAKLSPNAREFVLALRSLKGAWHDLQQSVQQSLFAGLGGTIVALARTAIPQLKTAFVGLAGEINRGFKASMGVFMQPKTVADFGTTLGNIQKAFHNLTNAAAPLTHLFVDLTTVGSSFLPQLTGGLTTALTKFADLIAKMRASGQLQAVFQNALNTIKQLWTVVSHLAGGIVGIFKAAMPGGQAILKLLGAVSGNLSKLINSKIGQSSLATFFNGISSALGALQPAFAALTGALVTSVLPAIGGIVKTLTPVVNGVLVQFADMIAQIAPLIYPALAGAIATLLQAIVPLIPVITEMATRLFPVLAQIIKQLAPIISEFADAVGKGVLNAFNLVLPLLLPLANAFGKLLTFFTPMMPILVPLALGFLAVMKAIKLLNWVMESGWLGVIGLVIVGLVALWTHSKTFRTIVTDVMHAVGAAAKWLWEKAIKPAWDAIKVAWSVLMVAIKLYWDYYMHPVFNAIAAVAGWLWNNILKPVLHAIGAAWKVLATLIGWWWDHIVKPIFNAWMTVATILFRILVVVVFGAIKLAWLALSKGIQWAWEHVLKPVWDAVATAGQWLWTKILKPIFDAMSTAWSALGTAMKWVNDHVLSPVFTAFGEAATPLTELFKGVVDGIKTAWNTLMDILSTPVNFVIQMVFNKGLFPAWNWAVDNLGLPTSWHAPAWQQLDHGLKFADGGVIPGHSPHARADNIPFWGTAGEFVQPVRAVRQYGPAFMEDVRTGRFPAELARGYADGGMIWQQLDAKRKQWFPGSVMTSGYLDRIGSPDFHGQGKAIDIGWPGNDRGQLDRIAAALLKLAPGSAEIIHNPNASVKNGKVVPSSFWGAQTWADHMTHVHWAVTNLAQIGKGGGGPGFWDWVKDPIGALMNAISGPLKSLKAMGNNSFVKMATGLPGTLASKLGHGILDKAGHIVGSAWDATTGAIGDVASSIGNFFSPDSPEKQATKAYLKDVGFGSDADWSAFNNIAGHESSWNIHAHNPGSSASGLLQLLDPTWWKYRSPRMLGVGRAMDAPLGEQVDAGIGYMRAAYGGPQGAWDFWKQHKFYDRGGYLPPGITTVMNATGRPEPVLTASEHDSLLRWRGVTGNGAARATQVAGFVNNGTVLTTDLGELARQSRIGTARALLQAGL